MPGLIPYTLQQALRNVGNAEVFVGSAFAGGMASLGALDGPVGVDIGYSSNDLTAKWLTGNVPHQRSVSVDHARIKMPLIMGDPTLWAKINPVGTKGGGWQRQMPVQEMTVLVIPRAELGGGLSAVNGVWTRVGGNGVPDSAAITTSSTLAAGVTGTLSLTAALTSAQTLGFKTGTVVYFNSGATLTITNQPSGGA